MKVVWEIRDIKSGVIVGKPGKAERSMIGYIPSRHKRCLVSLADAMVIEFENDEELVDHINRSGDRPISLLYYGSH